MEISYSKKKIVLNREWFAIDKFTLKFVSHLEKQEIPYVLISGYVALAFGRSRNTEDVDLFIGKTNEKKFTSLWKALEKDGFECINAKSPDSGYSEYLLQQTALRFCLKGQFIPNVEIKFPKNRLDEYSLNERVELVLNGEKLFISPLELQIAYKAYLGSDKDIEDAVYLLEVLKGKLDISEIRRFMGNFNISESTKAKLVGI
jgi:predicted nucleotidyltransferase